MTIAGWALIIAGVCLAIYAMYGYDPSIDGYVGGDYGPAGSRINNIGLLQRQLMLFIGGCALFVSGAICGCTALVCKARG